jgi:wyosine [tRNA(Phe)-imidazoG37] synthetase (radical SAM superfamily)
MSIIFGPINSRRFGRSLGIDLSPTKKRCNFDCLYCELEPAKAIKGYGREDIISVEDIIEATKDALMTHKNIDVITVTANGEPTLYPYLYDLVVELNGIKGDIKSLILSNGSTIDRDEVQRALILFDEVKLSLDCATQRCLKRLDRAYRDISIDDIKDGMLSFRERYDNSLIIEILFVKGINDNREEIEMLNRFLSGLNPTRIDIGTVDRPPAYRVEPLSYGELRDISLHFNPELPICITSRNRLEDRPSRYSKQEIMETIKKRPLTRDDIEILFDDESKGLLRRMIEDSQLRIRNSGGYDFFVIKD